MSRGRSTLAPARLASLALLALLATSSTAGAQEADTARSEGGAAAEACVPLDLAGALAVIPQRERGGVRVVEAEARVATAELDGAAPAEVLVAATGSTGEDGALASAVWALRCEQGTWTLAGRIDLAIDRAWNGTLDETPGVRVLRAERVPGVGHELARIEHVDVRGGADPRFVCERVLLAHLVDGALVVALDVMARCETWSGPGRRAEPLEVRSLRYRDAGPPAIVLVHRSISPRGRRRTRCRTVLAFDGRAFAPADPTCR